MTSTGRLFRTVRQAEPFREMGKFLGMTVLAGGALYFVNEPVAAFFYTRQAAQEETRKRQEVAAREHAAALAKEREEYDRHVGLAQEYLRRLEERVYTGPMDVTGQTVNIAESRPSGDGRISVLLHPPSIPTAIICSKTARSDNHPT